MGWGGEGAWGTQPGILPHHRHMYSADLLSPWMPIYHVIVGSPWDL